MVRRWIASRSRSTHQHDCRVKRGVSAQHPNKYVLDDKELERVAELAHIELEDARTELMRAHAAAQSMGQEPELDNVEDDDSESGWVE